MKKIKITLLLILTVFTFSLNAQTIGDYIDIVHFKNGSSVKGVIVEQVPGESVKLKALDGQEYTYAIEEIAKFSREMVETTKVDVQSNESGTATAGKCCPTSRFGNHTKFMQEYKKKENGYFVEFNLLAATNSAAFRVVNGYRFGRMGNVGIALGIENIATAKKSMAGVPAASLNLVYTGELFDRKVTPFIQVEGGYGIALKRKAGDVDFDYFDKDEEEVETDVTDALYFGGPMSGLVLGFKIRTKKKLTFKLGLDARLVSQFSTKTHTIVYEDGSTKDYLKNDFEVFPGVGARFGIGF